MQSPRHLTDPALILNLKSLVEKERQNGVEILHYLREVEGRGIHLARGYTDLYRFTMEELGYSSGAAYRRISAMRLLTVLPELEKDVQSGELKLESVSLAQSTFRKENLRRRDKRVAPLTTEEKRDIATSLVGQTTREASETLIAKFP